MRRCWPGNVFGVSVEGLVLNCDDGPVAESGEFAVVLLTRRLDSISPGFVGFRIE